MKLGHTSWTRTSPTYPDHSEFMEILPDVGRIICSTVICFDTIKNWPMAMAYLECGPGHIKTQLKPGDDWVDHKYRFEDDVMIWNHAGGADWPWISIPCDELPSWFAELKRKALIRMDEREQLAALKRDTQQDAPSNGG